MTPVKSIRKYCLDCAGNSPKEVRFCPAKTCHLYPFRMGQNPNYFKSKPTDVKILEDTKEEQKTLDINPFLSNQMKLKESSHGQS